MSTDRPQPARSCDSEDCLRALISYESARDWLVQSAADINHALDSRNQNGVVAGVGGAAAAAGAGLAASPAAISAAAGLTFLFAGGAIFAVSLGRAGLDYVKTAKAREQCHRGRAAYLEAKQKLMETCPHACWPVFIDVACQ